MEGVNLNAATAFGIIFLARMKRVKKKEKKEKETKSRCYTIGQNDVCISLEIQSNKTRIPLN